MKNNTEKMEKIHTIDDFSHGDWICFLLESNKKCVGTILEILIPDKENNSFFVSKKIINYIDEDGMLGSMEYDKVNKQKMIIGIDILSFFNKKFTLKIELNNNIQTRKIARDFTRKLNLKNIGKINRN